MQKILTQFSSKLCSLQALAVHGLNPPLFRDVSWGGDFPEKKFLVIRRSDPAAGLLSHVMTNLGWIKYARENGYVPIVDMRSLKNLYLNWFEVGRVNAWEPFFEQPDGYDLRDIRHAKNVTIVTGVSTKLGRFPGNLIGNETDLAIRRNFVSSALRIREDLLRDHRDIEFEDASPRGLIGAFVRGTDYVTLKPHGHPVQPDADMVIQAIRDCRANGHADKKVYLVTEDPAVVLRFQQAFGTGLIVSKQRPVEYRGGYLASSSSVSRNSRNRGAAYLAAINNLSRCDCLIGGRANGASMALLLSKGMSTPIALILATTPRSL